jgi:hypothetical protein
LIRYWHPVDIEICHCHNNPQSILVGVALIFAWCTLCLVVYSVISSSPPFFLSTIERHFHVHAASYMCGHKRSVRVKKKEAPECLLSKLNCNIMNGIVLMSIWLFYFNKCVRSSRDFSVHHQTYQIKYNCMVFLICSHKWTRGILANLCIMEKVTFQLNVEMSQPKINWKLWGIMHQNIWSLDA